jgi:histone H3/H4
MGWRDSNWLGLLAEWRRVLGARGLLPKADGGNLRGGAYLSHNNERPAMNKNNKTSQNANNNLAAATVAHDSNPLWKENAELAEFERRFYQESTNAMIKAEQRPSLMALLSNRAGRMCRRIGDFLGSIFRWSSSVSTTTVQVGKVIRDLGTPVQRLASSYTEHRRRRTEA